MFRPSPAYHRYTNLRVDLAYLLLMHEGLTVSYLMLRVCVSWAVVSHQAQAPAPAPRPPPSAATPPNTPLDYAADALGIRGKTIRSVIGPEPYLMFVPRGAVGKMG